MAPNLELHNFPKITASKHELTARGCHCQAHEAVGHCQRESAGTTNTKFRSSGIPGNGIIWNS